MLKMRLTKFSGRLCIFVKKTKTFWLVNSKMDAR